jgi:23S rRNA pseudouridine1911/1915/1917 synthase
MSFIFQPFGNVNEPEIIFRDERFLAVFKPTGIHCVHSGLRGNVTIPTLAQWIGMVSPKGEGIHTGGGASRAMNALKNDADEHGMLNRLDGSTSGIVLFALDQKSFDLYRVAQGKSAVDKYYIAISSPSSKGLVGSKPIVNEIVRFEIERASGMLEKTLEISSEFRSFGPRGSKVACIGIDPGQFGTESEKGPRRQFVTEIKSASRFNGFDGGEIESIPSPEMSKKIAFEIMIHAGHRHQIRAHLAWSGFPIVGDTVYGGDEGERLFLEAHGIEFELDDGYSFSLMLS